MNSVKTFVVNFIIDFTAVTIGSFSTVGFMYIIGLL